MRKRETRERQHENPRDFRALRMEIEELATQYHRAPSPFLAAVIGGVLGGSIAGVCLHGSALLLCGPLASAFGGALGVLVFRGRNCWRLERATQKAREALCLLKEEIALLPIDAPSLLRESVYAQYESLLEEYSRVARTTIDDDASSSRFLRIRSSRSDR
jgi:hypothetical protein